MYTERMSFTSYLQTLTKMRTRKILMFIYTYRKVTLHIFEINSMVTQVLVLHYQVSCNTVIITSWHVTTELFLLKNSTCWSQDDGGSERHVKPSSGC